MRKFLALLLAVLLVPLASARAEHGAAEAVTGYLNALRIGDPAALNFLADPSTLEERLNNRTLKELVYPAVQGFEIIRVEQSGDRALVDTRIRQWDVAETLRDVDFYIDWEYQPDNYPDFDGWLDALQGDKAMQEHFRLVAARHEITLDARYVCLQREGQWLLSLEETADMQRRFAPSFNLQATSYGLITPDYATLRYHDKAGRENPPNIWLRLDSTEPRVALEYLKDFQVVQGNARSADKPVGMVSLPSDNMWTVLHYAPKGEYSRGVLEMWLQAGENMDNLVLQCTRQVHAMDVLYYEDVLTLPLQGIPLDSGYPENGARFAARQYARYLWTQEQVEEKTKFRQSQLHNAAQDVDAKGITDMLQAVTGGVTIEDMLTGENQPMPGLPLQVLKLPYDTNQVQLYALQGTITKKSGSFGVYDVTFSLENPPPGVWVAAYSQCDSCAEIDTFDMDGNDMSRPNGLSDIQDEFYRPFDEELERTFEIFVLVRTENRTQQEITALLQGVELQAAFSAEKLDISYEQHGTTSRVGPRSTERVDMQHLAFVEGVYNTLQGWGQE